LNDGRLVPGIVQEKGELYLVTQRVGTMRFPSRTVEGVFGSVGEAYQHKIELLPEHDVDERLKLARWCLNQRLATEAKEQLSHILQLDPNNGPAQAMLTKIGQEQARIGFRRDPAVRQAGAEGVSQERGRAMTLDSVMIDRAQSALRISGLPVIFDLPRPLAIKRADEFFRFVHPLLQAQCARCHNGEHDGRFQLVPIKSRLDRTPDALRHNLDAALALVNREIPSNSELLTSTLRAHGRSPNPRPIYPGSNDRHYQILAAWVNGLRAQKSASGAERAEPEHPDPEQAVPFAADRPRVSLEPATGEAARVPHGAPGATQGPDRARATPDLGVVVPDQDAQNPKEFPIPFAVSGVKAPASTGGASSGAAGKSSARAQVNSPSGPGTAPSRPDTKAKPGSDASADASAADPSAPKKPAKAVKLNPLVLEQLLKARNQNR
jgi:hypothetical protein